MSTKTETIKHRFCDLCEQEVPAGELYAVYRNRPQNRAYLVSDPNGQVDVCTPCQARPVSDLIEALEKSCSA